MIALIGPILIGVAIVSNCRKHDSSLKSPSTISSEISAQSPGTKPADALEIATIPEIPDRPKGERVLVNGISMYYEVMGEGEPLLLINGGAATIESWFGQIPELRKHYQIIATDSRGQGRTQDGDGPIDFDVMASDYEALLDHLKLKNVRIVGWSDGGVIGFKLALRRPDLVKMLVTLGSHSRPEGMTEEFKLEVESASADKFPAILVDGYKALSPDGPEHWPVVFNKLKTMWLTQPNFLESELGKIQCPVFLVVGEHDIIRRDESERLDRLIPNAQLKVLDGASHYSPVEIPAIVNAEILKFFARP